MHKQQNKNIYFTKSLLIRIKFIFLLIEPQIGKGSSCQLQKDSVSQDQAEPVTLLFIIVVESTGVISAS